MNETENKNTIYPKINTTKNWFLVKISKTDKLLARLTKEKNRTDPYKQNQN